MSFPGAIPPPAGIVPNLAHPQDVIRICSNVTNFLTVVVVSICIAIRIYAKIKLPMGNFFWEDYSTYSAYVLMLGYCAASCCANLYGGGVNAWEVSPEDMRRFAQCTYAITIIYPPLAFSVKLSLLLIIERVFGGVHKEVRYGIRFLLLFNTLYYSSGLLIKIFFCRPISAYWEGDLTKCLDQRLTITADAVVSFISDLAILILPIPLTCSLQMPLRKKLHVMGMLCAGGVATGFSVYRLVEIVTQGSSPNQTVVFMKVLLSGNAEVGFGIITACLPAIKRVYDGHVKGTAYFARTHTTSKNNTGNFDSDRNIHVHTHTIIRPYTHAAQSAYQSDHDETGLVASSKVDCYTMSAMGANVPK